jgi:hypothetical protein
VSIYHLPYGASGDIAMMDNGNLLVTGNRGATLADIIYEIDIESGSISNVLDLKSILQRTRTTGSPEYSITDWFHNNVIVYENKSIVISGRNQSSLAKISFPDGELEWVFSDPNGWSPMFRRKLLTPVGDNFEWFHSQSSFEILPDMDGNPNTMDVLVFDNGNGRFINDTELQATIANNKDIIPDLYSRIVHYRVNEQTRTVEQLWQFGKEQGTGLFSKFFGSAGLLDNGNVLGAFERVETFERFNEEHESYDETINLSTSLIEFDFEGNIVWEAYATSLGETGTFHTYRARRIPFYTVAANDLGIGSAVRVLLP